MMHVFRFRVFVQPRTHEIARGWVRAGSLAEARAIIGHRHVEFDPEDGACPLPPADFPAVVWHWTVGQAASASASCTVAAPSRAA